MGVFGKAPNTTLTHNVIQNTRGFGITTPENNTGNLTGLVISNNFVYNTDLQQVDDVAAIYFNADQGQGLSGNPSVCGTSTNITIRNNYVRDLSNTIWAPANSNWPAGGMKSIYLDNYAAGVAMTGNVMMGRQSELSFLHGTCNSTVQYNIMDISMAGGAPGSYAMAYAAAGGSGATTMTGNSITNNIVVGSWPGAGTFTTNQNGANDVWADWYSINTTVPTLTHNFYYNYTSGGSIPHSSDYNNRLVDAAPTDGIDPLFNSGDWTFTLAGNSPARNSPVSFVQASGWGQPGFWGPPGYSIPNVGTAPVYTTSLVQLQLDNATFVINSTPGTSIGSILNQTPGSTLTITGTTGPSGAVTIGSGLPSDCTSCTAVKAYQLLVGSTAVTSAGSFTVTIQEAKSGYTTKSTTLTITASATEVPIQPVAVAAALPGYMYGTNITGMENCGYNTNSCSYTGPNRVNGTNYFDPGWAVENTIKGYGFSIVRLALDEWSLQPTLGGNLNQGCGHDGASCYLKEIIHDVEDARSLGLWVILDIHTYDQMYNLSASAYQLIGSSSGPTNANFANLWTRLSTMFKNYPNVIYGLMNEPNGISATAWQTTASGAISAIRTAEGSGTHHIISIPGTAYTTAATWVSSGNGTAWAG